MTIPKLKSEMDRAVSLPGVANIWTQPIINRIDMLTTGIRSEIGVKVFGADLTVLEAKAHEIAVLVRTVKARAMFIQSRSRGFVSRHPPQPRSRGPLRHRRRCDSGRDRDRHRRKQHHHNNRRASALSVRVRYAPHTGAIRKILPTCW